MAKISIPKNCSLDVRLAIQEIARRMSEKETPTFVNIILTGLATGLLHIDGDGNISAGSLYVSEYGALYITD